MNFISASPGPVCFPRVGSEFGLGFPDGWNGFWSTLVAVTFKGEDKGGGENVALDQFLMCSITL